MIIIVRAHFFRRQLALTRAALFRRRLAANDVSVRVQGIFEKRIPLERWVCPERRLLIYARLEGLSRSSTQPNETGLVSAQFTRSAP